MADEVFVARKGDGPPVLFVHGSVVGASTWRKQRPLAKRWTTMVLDRRGFGKSPPAEGEDFDVDARDIAAALGDGAHLVAHSYGAVGALLAATARPEAVTSLTLVEPVVYSVAADDPAVRDAITELNGYVENGPTEPRAFLEGFLPLMGIQMRLPEELPPAMEETTRLLMNSVPPSAAHIPLDELARADIPTLVVSGKHSAVFETICNRVSQALDAERAVVPGAAHAIPSLGAAFNDRLESFLSTVESQPRGA